MKYNITYEPEISNDNNSLKRTILRQLKSDLSGIFEKYYLHEKSKRKNMFRNKSWRNRISSYV